MLGDLEAGVLSDSATCSLVGALVFGVRLHSLFPDVPARF